MELGPIPGIRALPAVKAQEADFRPPVVFDIGGSAKPGDGGGQRGSRKAAGAEEDGEEDLTLDGEIEPGSEPGEEVAARQVDYFA